MNNIPSPRTDDAGIEQHLRALGKTAPRVTPEAIAANIASEHYFTAAEGVAGAAYLDTGNVSLDEAEPLMLLTICVLVLRNGFTVLGQSACASPENFDADTGRRLARADAVDKIWPLMGYQLKQHLYDSTKGVGE